MKELFEKQDKEHLKQLKELVYIRPQSLEDAEECWSKAKSHISKIRQETLQAERKAWLSGERCFTCGGEKEITPLSDTCKKCWEEE